LLLGLLAGMGPATATAQNDPAPVFQPVAPPTTVPDDATVEAPALVETAPDGTVPGEGDVPATDLIGPPADAAPSAVDADQARLEAFVDGVVEAFRQRDRIAGVTVGILRAGRPVLVRGYGHAALDPVTPVDPERHLFRIASVTKTFTYVAAMQLIEQGKLSLDDAVNDRLPERLQVPDDGFPEPILIRHLLTHTAGYEDLALGHLFVRDPAAVLAADDYLIQHRPRRVRPPGREAVYSNYSVALLGAVVAHRSGMPIEDYVERELFGPLGMTRSTLREPGLRDQRVLEGPLGADIATGFVREAGAYVARPFEHISQTAAAGGASSTAPDMLRFAAALLGDGSVDGNRILSPDSNAALREVIFSNAEGINGLAHGFITDRIGQHDSFGHGGATLYFHSNLVMVPSLDLAVFISTNTATGRRFAAEFPIRLVEFLDPAARPSTPASGSDTSADLGRYAGTYLSNRRPWRSPDALLLTLSGAITTVTPSADALIVTSPLETLRYLPEGEHRFREDGGHRRIAFLTDDGGAVRALAAPTGILVSDRIGPFGNPQMVLIAVLGAVLIGIASLVRLVRASRKRPVRRPDALLPQFVASIASLTWILFAIVVGAALATFAAYGDETLFHYPTPSWQVALVMALVVAALTVIQLLMLPQVWRSRWRGFSKLVHTLGVLWLAATVWLMWRWNLLGGPV
jgi:CubicO group peptidase (beta-lactamase class C family)